MVFMQTQDGDTVLHAASRAGHNDIVAYLIDKGANVNATNKVRVDFF